MGDLDALALLFPCGYCGAQPEEWCVTARPYSRPAGQRVTWLHEARLGPLREAWRAGWRDGQAIQADNIAVALGAAQRQDAWAVRSGVPVVPSAAWPALREWLGHLRERASG